MSPTERQLFTSESVTKGHPDKMADQISDAILDSILKLDPNGRVACETLVATGMAVVAGEVTTSCYVDIPDVVRSTVREIGYTDAATGYDCQTCAVIVSLNRQSPDIAMGVDTGGAGDQGMMFGYACRESDELMPLPIQLAHRIVERLAEARESGEMKFLRPDGKSQVTIEYEEGRPVRVHTVVVSTQHTPDASLDAIRDAVIQGVIRPVVPKQFLDKDTVFHINPTGRFVIGGPMGDTGLTGRKIIVDTYGGRGRHGGGAFSGKDPTKVDRSAAYAARWVAKNVVAAGLADRCEVQIAYAIGVAQPVSLCVSTEGTGRIPESKIAALIRKHFDLTPKGIITSLDLRRPIYRETARHGHFGRKGPGFTWERTDKADALKRDAGLSASVPGGVAVGGTSRP